MAENFPKVRKETDLQVQEAQTVPYRKCRGYQTRQTQREPHQTYHRRLVQDGRVEGHALTPSCESTGITTNCWTIINSKTLELTKKHAPHPNTKEKPQWDGRRGTITIKSNPITTGWVTQKLEKNCTTEVHPLEWSFWAPHQASQPGGSSNGRGNSQRIRLWWPAGFDGRTLTGLEETKTLLLEGTHKVVCTSGPRGKEQWRPRRLNQTYLLVLEGCLHELSRSPPLAPPKSL